MNACVYELILESDDTFVFSCTGDQKAVKTLKRGEAAHFDDRTNLVSDTLKVADSDVDKFVFSALRSLRSHLFEGQNAFVAKKSLGNGTTEVVVWGRQGIGSNISDRYIFFLNAKE